MTTDKTPATLATVKHGGCVRLATVPYDRARELIGDAYNAGTHGIGYSQQAMELHDAVITAQPSPGGQGEVREQFEAWLDTLRLDRSRHGDGYVWNDVELAWRAVEKFAARQPVRIYGCCAQPEGELHTAECPNMRHLSARQPVGNEPAFYLSAGAWGHIRIPMTPTRDVKAFRHGFDHGDTELVPFYATPPAQAVDLGQQQDAARWRAIAPHLSVEWDEDEMLKRWTWIDFKGDALSVPTRTRESYASVDEAMDAVIDSQAVQS